MKKTGEIWLDAHTAYEVYSGGLIDRPQGRDACIIWLHAYRKGDEHQTNPVSIKAGFTGTLLACTPFRERNDIEEITKRLGLSRLKTELRKDTTPRECAEVLLATTQWEQLIQLNGSTFRILEDRKNASADRRILKERFLSLLSEVGSGLDYYDIPHRLGVTQADLTTPFAQLRDAGLITEFHGAWCLTEKGETAVVNGFEDQSTSSPNVVPQRDDKWDVFISHASEDKQDVVEPLAEQLVRLGLKVWYDRWVLTIGDSLSGKIDEGLSKSKYGIVVLSHSFFGRAWPKRELDGLVAKEVEATGEKVILPIWHGLTKEDVTAYSPTLAGKMAGNTSMGLEQLAIEIVRSIEKSKSISD